MPIVRIIIYKQYVFSILRIHSLPEPMICRQELWSIDHMFSTCRIFLILFNILIIINSFCISMLFLEMEVSDQKNQEMVGVNSRFVIPMCYLCPKSEKHGIELHTFFIQQDHHHTLISNTDNARQKTELCWLFDQTPVVIWYNL